MTTTETTTRTWTIKGAFVATITADTTADTITLTYGNGNVRRMTLAEAVDYAAASLEHADRADSDERVATYVELSRALFDAADWRSE